MGELNLNKHAASSSVVDNNSLLGAPFHLKNQKYALPVTKHKQQDWKSNKVSLLTCLLLNDTNHNIRRQSLLWVSAQSARGTNTVKMLSLAPRHHQKKQPTSFLTLPRELRQQIIFNSFEGTWSCIACPKWLQRGHKQPCAST